MNTKTLLKFYKDNLYLIKDEYKTLNLLNYFNLITVMYNEFKYLLNRNDIPSGFVRIPILPRYIFTKEINIETIVVPIKINNQLVKLLWQYNKKVISNPFIKGTTRYSPFNDKDWQEEHCQLKKKGFQSNRYVKICTSCGAILHDVGANKVYCDKCGEKTLEIYKSN